MIAHTCVAKSMFFARRGSDNNKLKQERVTLQNLCTKCRSVVSAGSGRPAARTYSDDFCFPERVTFISTWMRPLPGHFGDFFKIAAMASFSFAHVNVNCSLGKVKEWLTALFARDTHKTF